MVNPINAAELNEMTLPVYPGFDRPEVNDGDKSSPRLKRESAIQKWTVVPLKLIQYCVPTRLKSIF